MDEIEKLREALRAIDRRNDSMARFDSEINAIVRAALSQRPEQPPAQDELLPCPFCGNALEVAKRRYNPHARCVTENCKGAQLPLLNIDQPDDVARWNTRPAQTEQPPGSRELSFVQAVPTHCDRIVWRGRYYHLPLADTTRPAQTEQQPLAWLIDWPEEPELGHYFSDEPNEHARSRPLYAAPVTQTTQIGETK